MTKFVTSSFAVFEATTWVKSMYICIWQNHDWKTEKEKICK